MGGSFRRVPGDSHLRAQNPGRVKLFRLFMLNTCSSFKVVRLWLHIMLKKSTVGRPKLTPAAGLYVALMA